MYQRLHAVVPLIGGVTGFFGGFAAIGNAAIQYKKDNDESQVKSEQFLKDAAKKKLSTVIPVDLGANPDCPAVAQRSI
jgi:1-deoxy-D-xylulose 5-phosphate reductoisomerase